MNATRTKPWLGFGLASVVILSVAIGVLKWVEPSYQGQSVRAWIARLSKAPDSDDEARLALRRIGLPAVPSLVRAFEQNRGIVSRTYAWFWIRLPASCRNRLPKPFVEDVPLRLAALNGLGLLGSRMHEAGTVTAAAGSKFQLAAGVFAEALQSTNEFLRIAAARALAEIRPKAIGMNANDAVPGLLRMLASPSLSERKLGARALLMIGPGVEAHVAQLLSSLNSKNRDLRLEVARAFGDLGADAESFVPFLLQLLADSDERMRWVALSSLAKIGRYPPGTKRVLEGILNDTNDYRRAAAGVALWRMDFSDTNALSIVLRYLTWTNEGAMRTTVANLLATIGPPAKAAMPTLQLLLHDRNPNVVSAARSALNRINPVWSKPSGE